MTEPVEWRADGTPLNLRFGDIYHSEAGGAVQSRHVFLQGCGLPEAWQDQPHW
jgi:tRNA 5-methylaminomethyl-2-thiouridine biosynthesis bifunctional protein